MVCRNKERGEAALSEIQSKTGNSNVHLEGFGYLLAMYLFFEDPSMFTSFNIFTGI